MAWLVILAVLALPVAEIMVWIKSAEWIGAGPTIFVSVGAVLAGIHILRRQGLATLLDARTRLERGEMPVDAAFDGLCLAAAGFLLVLPGLLTDVMALPLLIPAFRRVLRHWVLARAVRPVPSSGPVVIEAEYTVVEPRPGEVGGPGPDRPVVPPRDP